MIRALDVVWIEDDTISPPGHKKVACVHPGSGWFYRINTKPWRPAVPLAHADHPFLAHDSWLECGDPLQLDDFVVEAGLRRRGAVGRLSPTILPEVRRYMTNARGLSEADKDAIRTVIDATLADGG